ncbi:MAG TPA: histidinol dehydrogenase, partial [Dysgonamonadaceae bacterium]|nr:histidinol dehydrogenase [Dysgonamonadaceae bacterium]
MKTISNPAPAKWEKLARRPEIRPDKLRKMVNDVFRDIAKQGDRAVLKYSRKFDYPEQTSLSVEQSMIDKAADNLSQQLKQSIDLARQNIEKFHLSQREVPVVVETVPGVTCWRESRAIEKVGIYIPGGSAPLFSTVLMLAIPAKIACCSEIVLCTPPDKFGNIHPAILYTAQLTGVTKIFAIGGMQAIGAMTFGTESVP